MILLKIIYFHVYNAYYKDGSYQNDIPYLTAYGITGTSIGCLMLTLIALLNYLFTKTRLSIEICLSVFLLCLVAFFILFIYKARYNDVYASMKDSKWDTKAVKITVWAIIILGYASVGLYSYIFNNKSY